jgi:hypothetical protein
MRLAGFEPATLGLEGRCSIRLSYRRILYVADQIPPTFVRGRGIRTPDILLPKQARYQTALYPVYHFMNKRLDDTQRDESRQ